MKKKIFLMIAIISMLACLFAVSVSAEVTTYDDAPVRTKYQALAEDVVVFDDGFSCPTSYVFKDQNEINGNGSLSWAFDFAYINGKTGKSYEFKNLVEIDIPEGVTFIGAYAATKIETIKKISIPKTVTSMGQCVFQQTKNLEECTFEHTADSNLKTLNGWMFYGTALKAISLPDCIEVIEGENHFNECPNLTAVYLPANLTTFNTSGTHEKSSFCGDEKMYLVNEPFTYDNIPVKPAVYYFPANLTTISGESFKNCKNLDYVFVFGDKVTKLENAWAFCGTGSVKLVFLGNMETLHTASNGAWNVSKIYFCNENDKSSADFSIGKGYSYSFCNAEGNTEHLYLVNETLAADCENNAKTQTRCFCGKVEKVVEEPNTALGHDNDYLNGKATLVSIVYADLSKDGVKTVKCGVCGKDSELTASKVIDYKGYSKNDKGAMCMGYNIDQAALKEYEAKNGALTYGFVASANNNAPLEANGDKKDNVVKADLTGSVYNAVDFILTADDWTAEGVANAEISINLYVIVNNAVKYITVNGYSDTTEATKYSDIP